jgi:nucleoside phosphorylase
MSDAARASIAIVAAMEREIRPLICGWKVSNVEHAGRRYRIFQNGNAAVICGGIGADAARRATEAVIRAVNPQRVVSVGFAGALDSSLKVGDVIVPSTVINTADGARSQLRSGQGILLTSAVVANQEQKLRFAKAYGAVAVDMEAAAVAQGAQARKVDFEAMKVISDAADFKLPALDRFVASDGKFHSVQFAVHVALRPWMWNTAIMMASNSSKASHALCTALTDYLRRAELPSDEFSDGDEPEFAAAHTAARPVPHTQTEGKR